MSHEARAALRSAIATLQSALDALGGGIDWSNPIETVDGEPLVLEPSIATDSSYSNGPDGTPDSDGDYWINADGGGYLFPPSGGQFSSYCVTPDGCDGDGAPYVRNRR